MGYQQAIVPNREPDTTARHLNAVKHRLHPGDLVRSTHREITGVVLTATDDVCCVYFGHGAPHWYRWVDEAWSDTETLLALDS